MRVTGRGSNTGEAVLQHDSNTFSTPMWRPDRGDHRILAGKYFSANHIATAFDQFQGVDSDEQ